MTDLRCDNPFTGAIAVERGYANAAALDAIVDRASRAQKELTTTTIAQRRALVERAVQWFESNAERVAREISTTMGKPITESRGEIRTMAERARHLMSIAETALADEVLPARDGFHRFIAQEPVGVVLVIAPWNYPLLTAINAIAPAILAGNAVVLKHSARTPLCGEQFERAFVAVGAPEGLVANVQCDHRAMERLYARPEIGYVAFTGSVRGGREVFASVASQRFIDVGLELGGKDPAYVAADADLDHAIANVIDGAFYNAGQSCCAIERIYVHRSLHDRFVEGAAALVRGYRLGDPLDATTTQGPLAQPSAPAFLKAQIDQAQSKGGQVLCGGNPTAVDGRGRFFSPTIVIEATHEMSLMREESFGPVVGIAAVDSDEEAVRLMNDSPYGLTAAIWTRDVERALQLGRRLETGTVFMNRCDHLDPALPWTGVKDTGKGESLSRYGFLHVTRRKSYHFRSRT